MMLVDKHTIELTEKINASSKGGLISEDFLRGLQCSVSFSCVHYLDLCTQPDEPEKLLTSNIHLLSPQKWSHFVHFNIEKVFPREQP